ncbi:MAG TPA: hypothetical protein VJZ71_19830 [Phycisphaerae bacterium]|nr:hypothetical protein [Phycisphaerae bacterium]
MDAAHAYGLRMPVVEIGYAPLPVVRQALPWRDASVVAGIKSIVVGATLLPPTFGAIVVAVLLFAAH